MPETEIFDKEKLQLEMTLREWSDGDVSFELNKQGHRSASRQMVYKWRKDGVSPTLGYYKSLVTIFEKMDEPFCFLI